MNMHVHERNAEKKRLNGLIGRVPGRESAVRDGGMYGSLLAATAASGDDGWDER